MENAPMAKCRICRYAEGQPSKFDEQYALDILASLQSLLSHSSSYKNGSLGNICNVWARQEPMSRNLQLNYISVTAFSYTDLFLDGIYIE